MSEPKITLAQVLKTARSQPTTPELELASLEFQELPDAEQKDILFRALVQVSAQLAWVAERLK